MDQYSILLEIVYKDQDPRITNLNYLVNSVKLYQLNLFQLNMLFCLLPLVLSVSQLRWIRQVFHMLPVRDA
jgi:hypothetical protein